MKKITNKILLLSISISIFIGLSLGITFKTLTTKKQKADIEQLTTLLNNDFDLLIKYEVETANSILKNLYQLEKKGIIDNGESKIIAEHLIRELRYGKEGYFWVDDSNGNNVVLLGKDAEGKNRINLQDEKGNYFIKDIIKNAQKGGGYTDYWFSKKGNNTASPKRGYSLYFEPYDWVIGTGNYIDDINIIASEIKAENIQTNNRITTIMMGILMLVIVLSVIISIIMGKSITNPIHKIVKNMGDVAKGNLDIKSEVKTNDEMSLLSNSLNNMVINLSEIIVGIKNGAAQIASASAQISSTSELLSQGASEQASSVEEISSTMEEIAANIEQNSDNARETENISAQAENGIRDVSNQTKQSNKASSTIAEKIQIINDIAFQTNLLALNAAVEAARAGEEGKGFAIVANEVRKLAEKSRSAADEIINLSNDSAKLSDESMLKMESTRPHVSKTTQLVQEISAASREQRDGVNQINSAIQQLNNVTQSNASSSEELAGNSEELAAQAQELDSLMSFFTSSKIDETQTPPTT